MQYPVWTSGENEFPRANNQDHQQVTITWRGGIQVLPNMVASTAPPGQNSIIICGGNEVQRETCCSGQRRLAHSDTEQLSGPWKKRVVWCKQEKVVQCINRTENNDIDPVYLRIRGKNFMHFCFLRMFFCSARLHLYNQKYSKISNIVKYYYNLKAVFHVSI